MYYGNDAEAHAPQVTVMGMEFKPGAEADVEIERLLGFESESFGGKAHRRIGDDTQDLQWQESPDYCGDDAVCLEILEIHQVTPFVLKTTDDAKRSKVPFAEKRIAVFQFSETLYATMPFETDAQAVACVVWFVLAKLSHE
jgi:hypothetical protein